MHASPAAPEPSASRGADGPVRPAEGSGAGGRRSWGCGAERTTGLASSDCPSLPTQPRSPASVLPKFTPVLMLHPRPPASAQPSCTLRKYPGQRSWLPSLRGQSYKSRPPRR